MVVSTSAYAACALRELDMHDQGIKIPVDGLQFVRWGSAMKSTIGELSTILDRIVDKTADNLRIAKILVQLGLDPDNITYDAISNRLLEIFLANITIANICALLGAIFFVATLLTRTMVPLRVSNMISNVFFYGFWRDRR